MLICCTVASVTEELVLTLILINLNLNNHIVARLPNWTEQYVHRLFIKQNDICNENPMKGIHGLPCSY